MNQSRKFRRKGGFQTAKRGDPLPGGWTEVEAAERERANAAMKPVAQMLPGRGLVLLSIPPGTSSQNVEAMACVHNLETRSDVASVFEAMLEWWSGEYIPAQPDRALVSALREGVAAVRDIPMMEVAGQMGLAVSRLLPLVRAFRPAASEDLMNEALMIAVSALGLVDRFRRAQQHEAPGGSADGSGAPPPAPMPPPQKWPKGNTKETLVADLLERPQSEHRDQLIAMAKEGKFHDYQSEVNAPKALLIDILRRFGFPDLAGKARDGGYDDEHATVVEQEEMRAGAPELYDALMGNDPSKRGQG